jgi:transcription-repair coupling factor (superfamily II helicase)
MINNLRGKTHEQRLVLVQEELSVKKILQSYSEIENISFAYLDPEVFNPDPIEQTVSSLSSVSNYFKTLFKIYNWQNSLVYCTESQLRMPIVGPAFFDARLELSIDQIIDHEALSAELVRLGYQETREIDSQFCFVKKGEMVDVFTSNLGPIRIIFFDDTIESIYPISEDSYRSIKSRPYKQVSICQSPEILFSKKHLHNLRDNLPRPRAGHKAHKIEREELFQQLSSHSLPHQWNWMAPLLSKNESTTLAEYLILKRSYFVFNQYEQLAKLTDAHINSLDDRYRSKKNEIDFAYLLPSPKDLFKPRVPLKNFNHFYDFSVDNNSHCLSIKEFYNQYLFNKENAFKKNLDLIYKLYLFAQKNTSILKHIIICYSDNRKKLEIEHYLNLKNIVIHDYFMFIQNELEDSFYDSEIQSLYISSEDLIPKVVARNNHESASQEFFSDYISSLKNGDFVIHKDYGIGKYQGVKTVQSNQANGELIELLFADNDKVYIPLYKVNLLQKYAEDSENIKLANLNKKQFDAKKSLAQKSIKKLAVDLLAIHAKRKAMKGISHCEHSNLYFDFENSFPFKETPDQERAIHDVIDDMVQTTPMDRLICGDVGFGKTEIAMRAAMKSVEGGYQVALVAPTTILSLQHFISFKQRFKEVPVTIEYVSRFRSKKEINEIFKRVEEHKVDILIGTHAVFSKNLDFPHLGLVVFDEEHRFGVNHKEYFKNKYHKVDFLSLSATPIPRTLQLSFLGIKDISILKTPPLNRKNITTKLLVEDNSILENAIKYEIARQGQVFVVYNKVKSIDSIAARIGELVPEANVIVAHGQLTEKELEKRMNSFFQQKFNVLVSTTIIESGIDIPTANTLIILNSHQFGLSQLHQLRGRIGRSQTQAYAYFLVPPNRNLSLISEKRLEAIEKFSSVGSGFNIANTDLDIRGAGDILGAEQSGHLRTIGVELYLDMLQEEMSHIKGAESFESAKNDFELTTHIECSLPETYIHQESKRLKYYKKISSIWNSEHLAPIQQEFEDIYGKLPSSVENLFFLIRSRNLCVSLGCTSLIISINSIKVRFSKEKLEKNSHLLNTLISIVSNHPQEHTLKPDSSFLIKKEGIRNLSEVYSLLKHLQGRIAD